MALSCNLIRQGVNTPALINYANGLPIPGYGEVSYKFFFRKRQM